MRSQQDAHLVQLLHLRYIAIDIKLFHYHRYDTELFITNVFYCEYVSFKYFIIFMIQNVMIYALAVL